LATTEADTLELAAQSKQIVLYLSEKSPGRHPLARHWAGQKFFFCVACLSALSMFANDR
jgi:hypothetical protein